MNKHLYRQTRLFDSLRCAWKGLCWAVGTQHNLRRQLLIAAFVLALSGWAQLGAVRVAVLTLTIVMVLAMEVLNTALEALVDSLYPNYHKAAALVKDVAAGATLLAALGALLVGVALFWGAGELVLQQWVSRSGIVALQAAFAYLALRR